VKSSGNLLLTEKWQVHVQNVQLNFRSGGRDALSQTPSGSLDAWDARVSLIWQCLESVTRLFIFARADVKNKIAAAKNFADLCPKPSVSS